MDKCKYCGSTSYTIQIAGVHRFLICKECGKWLKNISQKDVIALKSKINYSKTEEIEEAKTSFDRAFGFINNPIACNEMGMRLSHWNEDVIVRVEFPDEDRKLTAPYLYVESKHGRVPWIPNQIELFSKDWMLKKI